jgi:hypothetical protein
MINFIIGLVIGDLLGLITGALLAVGKRGD